MRTYEFTGVAADRLWDNVRNDLSILKEAKESFARGDVQDGKRKMQAFMWICYAGSENSASKYDIENYGGVGERVKQVIDASDPDLYQLVRVDDPVRVELNLDGGKVNLDFGNVVGYHALITMNEAGYQAYSDNELVGSQVKKEHILSASKNKKSTEFLYISSVVHIPSLAYLFADESRAEEPFGYPGIDAFENALEAKRRRKNRRETIAEVPSKSSVVLYSLLSQIKKYLVPLWYEDGKLRTISGYCLPKVISPVSGRGFGEYLLPCVGFQPKDYDVKQQLRYVLDFGRFNDLDVKSDERLLMRRALSYLANS